MRQDVSQNSEISQKEQDVVSLENRRSQAEREFVIILDDKKRISAELEVIEKKIEDGKKALEDSREAIIATDEAILKIKSSLRDETQAFDKAIGEHKTKLSDLEKEVAVKADKKEKAEADFAAFVKDHDLKKFAMEQELKELKTRRDSYNDQKVQALSSRDVALKEKVDAETALSTAKDKVKAAEAELELVERTLVLRNNEVADQEAVIENKKKVIGGYEDKIKEKESVIVGLDGKITQKEADYKAVESKAFAILQREELLRNKEAFIKSQYERAGIKWDE